MDEYINKKALLDELCLDNCERTYDGTCHNCRMTETIADFPAADVAEVVRCYMCRAARETKTNNTVYCSVCERIVSKYGYCSYGIRIGREDENGTD